MSRPPRIVVPTRSVLAEVVERCRADARPSNGDPDSLRVAQVWSIRTLHAAYSLGATRDELRSDLVRCIGLVEQLAGTIGQPPLDCDEREGYLSAVWMTGLGALFDQDLVRSGLSLVVSPFQDALISRIAQVAGVEIDAVQPMSTQAIHADLLGGLDSDEESRPRAIAAFLADYENRMPSFPWHAPGADDVPPCGYWSFETAAVLGQQTKDAWLLTGMRGFPSEILQFEDEVRGD